MPVLKPLEPDVTKYPIAGFDSEFCPYHHGSDSFLCACFDFPGDSIRVTDPSHIFERVLTHRHRDIRFYAHNLGVDLANGLYPFLPDNWTLSVMVVGYRVLKATVADTSGHAWHFYDSAQLSAWATVSDLGELMGRTKLNEPFETGHCLCNVDVGETMLEYCLRDAEIVRVWIEKLQSILNEKFQSSLGNTIAGTTMDVWRRNYQVNPYPVLSSQKRAFIRESYNGGRTEMFFRGAVDSVECYDVNSLYPFVYSSYPFPDPSKSRHFHNPTEAHLTKYLDSMGVGNVTVRSPDNLYIPYLKYYDEKRGKLCFPTGTFTDTWTLFELREALQRGYEILDVNELLIFPKTIRPFETFGKALYEEKQTYGEQGKDIQYKVVKMLLNSFWGRFGINPDSGDAGFYRFVDEDTLEDKLENQATFTEGQLRAWKEGNLNYWFDSFNSRIPSYCHPEWATHVTAYARHELYGWFEEVGLENVFYCDTDSIYTSSTLPTGSEMGQLELEWSGTVEFVREKCYIKQTGEGYTVKGSGIRQEGFSGEELRDKIRNQDPIEMDIWGGITSGHWGKIETQTKQPGSSWVPKRMYCVDGTSKPLHIKGDTDG